MSKVRVEHAGRWREALAARKDRVASAAEPVVEGVLTRVVGLTLEAVGIHAEVGGRCEVTTGQGRNVEAEVVGFAGDHLYLMPTSELQGLGPNARVRPSRARATVPVGDGLLGRVIDGAGKPLDGLGPLHDVQSEPTSLQGRPINPLSRRPIREPLDTGVRSINALLTVGRGQRVGLFAGSGVGKSVLLGMMTRYTDADVVVVGLIGERGREVKEFVSENLGTEGMKKAVVVATPADTPPLMRLHGAWLATTIAEHFRDRGKKVLLLMDSLTRFAQAQREIALAIGEPPATKGYPPSVFARMPQLVERAGNGEHGEGSITAFYTVLTEGDDNNDPIADAARAILDGHFVLSRRIAEAGRFPAIDLEGSVSRAINSLVPPQQLKAVSRVRELYAVWQQHRDLISVGAYQKGSNPRVDQAIAMWPYIEEFLRQDLAQKVDFAESRSALEMLLDRADGNFEGEV